MPIESLIALVALTAGPPAIPAAEPTPGLVARDIGPGSMGGRIPTLDVVESSPKTWYVGAAAGGLWKTTDAGKSWVCVFAGRPNPSIGAVAVAPSNPDIVYVGTGEANLRNSVSWGNGVFISRDSGKTWRHAGLEKTRHIGRIAVHPRDPNTAFVAAVGRCYGSNPERGLYRTRDGGRTWDHVLKLDDETGCIDVIIDPREPKFVHAAAYRVRRGPFMGGDPEVQFGKQAGIHRSTDGGATFERVTKGLPAREVGRVGLAVYRKDPRILYAVMQTEGTDRTKLAGQPPTARGRQPGPADTGGIFRSDDRGLSWRKVNDVCPRPFYFSKIRIDPSDAGNVWVLGIAMFVSHDGGRTFTTSPMKGVHVDHHALWIDPKDARRMLLGNDGGLYDTVDGGSDWRPIRNLPISQFYAITADRREPYRVYGGLQDNGTWGGPSRSNNPAGILNSQWRRIMGMDGFHCVVPDDDPMTLYCEGQYGRPYRVDLRTLKGPAIRPRPPKGKPEWRFNWSSPLVLSPHNSKKLYYGGNVVFRSDDRGDTYRVISPDLTRGEPGIQYARQGHSLTCLAESSLRAGVLWAGSDDGRVHVSQDDGGAWEEVGINVPGLPVPHARLAATAHITRIEPSPYRLGTAYLSFSRHRQDDDAPYLMRTRDHGKTWQPIRRGLPATGPVHVVRADTRNRGLLFAGTEFGLHLSFDDGENWQMLECGLPPAPVHDLLIHPTARELVVGTHGRGIWIVDIAPLQELTAAVRRQRAHLFSVRVVAPPAGPSEEPPVRTLAGTNPQAGWAIHYRLRQKQPIGPARLLILDTRGRTVADLEGATEAGLHRVQWVPAKALVAGEYTIRLIAAGDAEERKVTVRGGDS